MATQRLGRIQWGDLLFGPGSPYAVSILDGLDDLPDIRSDDMERPGQHGDYTGPDTTGPRVITLGLTLIADDPDSFRQLVIDLQRATQPQSQPAALQLLDWDTLVYAKIRKRAIPYDAENLWRSGTATLELYCADPYKYGLDEQSASTAAYSPAAGRTYPLVPPRVYGDPGTSGQLVAPNGGAAPAYPVLRVDGPVASPSIEQTNTGALIVLDTTLQDGEYVLIDTRSRAVLYMGSTPRRSWVRGGSTWPLLLPGPNSIAYRGSALPGAPGQTSLLTVTWRDTSL